MPDSSKHTCICPGAATKQRGKTQLHMLHEHLGYCNSHAFKEALVNMLRQGCGEDIVDTLDLKPDATCKDNLIQAPDMFRSAASFSVFQCLLT